MVPFHCGQQRTLQDQSLDQCCCLPSPQRNHTKMLPLLSPQFTSKSVYFFMKSFYPINTYIFVSYFSPFPPDLTYLPKKNSVHFSLQLSLLFSPLLPKQIQCSLLVHKASRVKEMEVWCSITMKQTRIGVIDFYNSDYTQNLLQASRNCFLTCSYSFFSSFSEHF